MIALYRQALDRLSGATDHIRPPADPRHDGAHAGIMARHHLTVPPLPVRKPSSPGERERSGSHLRASGTEVDAIGKIEVSGSRSCDAGDTVLPDDRLTAWIDQNDPVIPVVVCGDQAIGQQDRQRGMVQYT